MLLEWKFYLQNKTTQTRWRFNKADKFNKYEIVNFHVNYIEEKCSKALNLLRCIVGHWWTDKQPIIFMCASLLPMQFSLDIRCKKIAYWTNSLWLISDNPTKSIIEGGWETWNLWDMGLPGKQMNGIQECH